MFSPSELEGEVDHSFFDSDCDDSTTSKDGGKKSDKGLLAEKENLPVPEKLQARQSQNVDALVGGRSPRTNGTKPHLKQVEKNNTSGAKKKEDSYGSEEEEMSRTSGISSIASTSDKVFSNGGDVEEVSSLHSKSINETFIALLAEGREMDDEDGYHQSQNESEEEGTHKYSGLKGRHVFPPKKQIRKCHTRSPSPPSTEADTDTDRSSGSSDESYSLEPRTRPKTSSFPRVRRTRVGSAGSPDLSPIHTEESEDTVTDVTPLSTPDMSPLQSLDLTEGSGVTKTEDWSIQEQQPESAPSSGLSNIPQEDEDSDHNVDECSLGSESQVGGELVFNSPGGMNRKNYSFSNDEVRRIDRENQRLLQKLSPRSKPGSVAGKTHGANSSPSSRLFHSGLNRQREQQRIERENLAFLKRLESVKPTPGMRRSDQLADYQRQARYPGASSCSIYRSSSRTPSGRGSRIASAATLDSTTTPVPRSNKVRVPRPAWC